MNSAAIIKESREIPRKEFNLTFKKSRNSNGFNNFKYILMIPNNKVWIYLKKFSSLWEILYVKECQI